MSHTKAANILKDLEIVPLEKEVILGSLIGDGCLEKSGKHYRLRIGHTIKHGDYVRWKYSLLKRFCITEPKYVPTTKSLRLGTVGHPVLSEIRNAWYLNGIKFIPESFKLTPLMLAIWFMDDGCKHGKSIDFSVHCFSVKSIQIFQRLLLGFGIATTVNSDDKGSRLYVKCSSYGRFEELVKPYMQPCMAYKLP